MLSPLSRNLQPWGFSTLGRQEGGQPILHQTPLLQLLGDSWGAPSHHPQALLQGEGPPLCPPSPLLAKGQTLTLSATFLLFSVLFPFILYPSIPLFAKRLFLMSQGLNMPGIPAE